MKRESIHVDAVLAWVIALEILLGIAILLFGCREQPKQTRQNLNNEEIQPTSRPREPQRELKNFEDSLHEFEDGL